MQHACKLKRSFWISYVLLFKPPPYSVLAWSKYTAIITVGGAAEIGIATLQLTGDDTSYALWIYVSGI
jgi:hypothetical protein